MDDLVVWLLEQVAEDERANNAPGRYYDDPGYWPGERVAAECESKRQILFEHLDDGLGRDESGQLIRNWPAERCTTCLDTGRHAAPVGSEFAEMALYPCRTLRVVAWPYADRPGYREEWKP